MIPNPRARKPITTKVIRDGTDLVVYAYAGKRKIGHLQAFKVRRIEELKDDCQRDLRSIQGSRPGITAYVVWKSHVSERYRQRGAGSALYKETLAHVRAKHDPGAVALVPMHCLSYGTTSTDARRVWTSLARRDRATELAVLANPPAALSKLRREVGDDPDCYPAAEALYHNAGGRRAGLTPMQQKHEGRSHWWVRGPEGQAWDPAASQFKTPVPYERGRGRGFLTKKPSKRARQLAKRARVKLNPPQTAHYRLGDSEIEWFVHPAVRPDAPPGWLQVTEFDRMRYLDGREELVPRGHVYASSIAAAKATILRQVAREGWGGPLKRITGKRKARRNPGMGCTIVGISEDSDFDLIEDAGGDPYVVMDQAEALFNASGIRISSVENLHEARRAGVKLNPSHTPEEDHAEFMASIPDHKRQWLDGLEEDHRKRVLNHWWLWWVNVGRKVSPTPPSWDEGPWQNNPSRKYHLRASKNGKWAYRVVWTDAQGHEHVAGTFRHSGDANVWMHRLGRARSSAEERKILADMKRPPVYAMNPDPQLRELERRYSSGDGDMVMPYYHALKRTGTPVPVELRARVFAQEHASDSIVTYPTGKTKKVKNLGWLMRQVARSGGSMTGNLLPLRFVVRTDVAPFPGECYLRVELSDGSTGKDWTTGPHPYLHTHTYETMFASCAHLWDWLQRAKFENEVLDWDGRVGTIARRMHESTFGHPAGSEGGPDAQCFVCGRRYWSGDEDADPEIPRCPTCFAGNRRRNPDYHDRGLERLALGGGPRERARHLMQRVRAGEVPMGNVALAWALAGRSEARLLDPPPYDHQYVQAKRDLVVWAMALGDRLPDRWNWRADSAVANGLRRWLDGGKRPPRGECHSTSGMLGLYTLACRMTWARSNNALHQLATKVVVLYRTAVYQRFMDEMAGHHEGERMSPAWTLTDEKGRVIELVREPGFSKPTVRYDQLRLHNASQRQAGQLLGKILLREE